MVFNTTFNNILVIFVVVSFIGGLYFKLLAPGHIYPIYIPSPHCINSH
jgi:hypothetical protein